MALMENRLSKIETDLVQIESKLLAIRETMVTKTWMAGAMLAQTFAILGGVAALLRLVH
jgi:hypothetical protein